MISMWSKKTHPPSPSWFFSITSQNKPLTSHSGLVKHERETYLCSKLNEKKRFYVNIVEEVSEGRRRQWSLRETKKRLRWEKDWIWSLDVEMRRRLSVDVCIYRCQIVKFKRKKKKKKNTSHYSTVFMFDDDRVDMSSNRTITIL